MLSLDLQALAEGYRTGRLTPQAVVTEIVARIDRRGDDKVWIHRWSESELRARVEELARARAATLPLYGIPFAIKLRGFICEAYATASAQEISKLGGWRAYVARGAENKSS